VRWVPRQLFFSTLLLMQVTHCCVGFQQVAAWLQPFHPPAAASQASYECSGPSAGPEDVVLLTNTISFDAHVLQVGLLPLCRTLHPRGCAACDCGLPMLFAGCLCTALC
jgi:hypothetical protein